MQTKYSKFILPALLLLSLGLNLILTHRLKNELSIAQGRSPSAALKVRLGAIVPALELKDERGAHQSILWNAGRPTLLYFFDPRCGWCKKNAESFNSLTESISKDVRVYSLTHSMSDIDNFKAASQHKATVLTNDKEDIWLAIGVAGTPTTLLVDQFGRLEKVWDGAYRGDTLKSIENHFKVSLPSATD